MSSMDSCINRSIPRSLPWACKCLFSLFMCVRKVTASRTNRSLDSAI